MNVIDKLPISKTYHILVAEKDGEFLVIRNCVFVPDAIDSRHTGYNEALQAAHEKVKGVLSTYEKLEPVRHLFSQRMRALGVEGALEYRESLMKKFGIKEEKEELLDESE